MKLLLHACCGPCSIQCAASLREEALEPVVFWYNPNIHPYTEYKSRKNGLAEFASQVGLSLVIREEYGLRPFITAVCPDFDNRCGHCYRIRMEETAAYAAQNGFDSFTTSLLISPYQNHELICAAAAEAAKKHGVSFLYRDFRPRFRQGQQEAREMALYMQKYCGCIFSEEERYQKKKKRAEV